MTARRTVRCAIYTRKSSEEGLEQSFNSLDAQHEACAAYVASQKGEGWVLLSGRYDDGGLSGGTLERPALKRLLAEVDARKIDQIVVYKVDRLTRSLADFARLVERLEAAGCSFVSVTQSFNTATSMGRLTLNVLLSFAQFEREVTAERIRDKIAASKRRGLWMGGMTPLGYRARDRTLEIEATEAETVRTLFRLYRELSSVRRVKAEADRLGLKSKLRIFQSGRRYGGVPFTRGRIYHLLANPVYAVVIRHKHELHPGQHPAIIPREEWDAVQAMLAANAARARRQETAANPSPLAGRFTDETGDHLTPSHATRRGRRHRYYVSHRLIAASGEPDLSGWRLPAATLEGAVATLIRQKLSESGFVPGLLDHPTPAEIVALRAALSGLIEDLGHPTCSDHLAALVASGRIAPGHIEIELDRSALADRLGIAAARIDASCLAVATGFTLRRRGVEAKLVLDDPAPETDPKLMRYLALGHAWFAEIRAGAQIGAIARREGTTRQRVAAIVDLAFLAPDIAEAIATGRQPAGLTADALIKAPHRMLWTDQRALAAGL